ncbi:MAG: hypothetical protein PGN13_10280 [Patulibacter minatonensis]
MKHTRAVWSLAAAALALAAPSAANAGIGAVGDTFGEATLGSLAKVARGAETSCLTPGATSNPFTRWNDRADYVEAPGGSFEPGAANQWATSGSVTTASENEPWRVSGRPADRSSVVLGGNGSITSAPLCAGIEYPTLRFFAKAPRGYGLALVTARYTGPDGLLAAIPVGTISVGSNWAPSTVALTGSGIPLITGTYLSIRIAPVLGSVQVDDVYVDPFRRS